MPVGFVIAGAGGFLQGVNGLRVQQVMLTVFAPLPLAPYIQGVAVGLPIRKSGRGPGLDCQPAQGRLRSQKRASMPSDAINGS